MAITTENAKIKISFVADTLFEKICNTSALNAKYVAEELNADSLIMSADERYFFNTNIENVVASLAGYFVRISDKTDSYTAAGANIEISFNSRNDFSKVEADILNALAENYIITEILKLWYHSVAPHEILATKYAGESASLDRRLRIALFQFYKPTTNNGFFDCIKVVGAPGQGDIHHINNRSDFILLWRPKDYSTLPDKFSVTFYTSGAETYEVQYPDTTSTPKVIPVTDGNGNAVAAQIVFDLTSSANYFADGRLQYTMVADIANPLFVDGYQTVESSDELPFEIWGGPSDSIAKIESMFIPAYAKLTLADLTDAEIAILQGPALEAANEAKTQAKAASTAAYNAGVAERAAYSAERAANNAADYANRAGSYAFETTNELNDVAAEVKDAEIVRENQEQLRKDAEASRVLAEQQRTFAFGGALNRVDTAAAGAEYQASQAAKERGELAQFVQDLKTAEDRRVEAEELRDKNEKDPITGRIEAENIRVNNENQRVSSEIRRTANEIARQSAESARETAEAQRQADTAAAISEVRSATATAVSNAQAATTAANSAATNANTAAATVEQFKNETTEQVDELETRIGVWNIASLFRIGTMIITTNGWEYGEANYRVTTAEGVAIPLKAGDEIILKDPYQVYAGWKRKDGTYGISGSWQAGQFTCPEDGDYVFNFQLVYSITELLQALEIRSELFGNTTLGGYVEGIKANVDSLLPAKNLIGEGNVTYWGDGSLALAITRKEFKCNRRTIFTAFAVEGGNMLRLTQSMAIYADRVFFFLDNTAQNEAVIVYDKSTMQQLYVGELDFEKSHNNSAQFSNYFYDSNDKYPLLMLTRGDYGENTDFYFIRIQESDGAFTFTLIKTCQCTIPSATNNGSWVANFEQKRLFLYTLANGTWQVVENNYMELFEFPLPNLSSSENETLSINDVVRHTTFDYAILQGASEIGGLLYILTQSVQMVNGVEVDVSVVGESLILVINPDNGRIVNIINTSSWEPQGIAFNDGKMYVCRKNGSSSATVGTAMFWLDEYNFDIN